MLITGLALIAVSICLIGYGLSSTMPAYNLADIDRERQASRSRNRY